MLGKSTIIEHLTFVSMKQSVKFTIKQGNLKKAFRV